MNFKLMARINAYILVLESAFMIIPMIATGIRMTVTKSMLMILNDLIMIITLGGKQIRLVISEGIYFLI